MMIYCFECERTVNADHEADHFAFDEEDRVICLIEKERQELREHYPNHGREK